MTEPAEEVVQPPDGEPVARPRWDALRSDLWLVLPAWLTARVLVGAAWVAARVVADRFGANPAALHDGLLAWDGTWYRALSTVGYDGLPREALRFFPGYPLLGRALGGPIGQQGAALVLIANLAALAVGVLVVRLVRLEGGSEAQVRRTVWVLMLFPSAFVLVWGYAEAVMLVGAVGAFLAMRRGQWWWAALGGFVAALCRPLGLVLVVPIAVEVVRAWRRSGRRPGWGALAALGAPVVGTAAFLGWVWVSDGHPLAPFTVQQELRGEAVNPLVRMWNGMTDLFGPERFGQGLHLPFAVVLVVLLVLTFRRWPVSYGLYAGVVLTLALAAQNLNSLERYGLNAFPVVLTLAAVSADERLERAVLSICAGGLVALTSLAWLAAYVP